MCVLHVLIDTDPFVSFLELDNKEPRTLNKMLGVFPNHSNIAFLCNLRDPLSAFPVEKR